VEAVLPRRVMHLLVYGQSLHGLPLPASIQFKILVLVLKSKLGVAPKYLSDHICSPLSAVSHRLLHALDWCVLFVP